MHDLDGDGAVLRLLDYKAGVAENLVGELAVELVVLDEEDAPAGEVLPVGILKLLRSADLDVAAVLDSQGYRNREAAALALSALTGNGSVHHLNQLFDESKAEARALDSAGRRVLLAGEFLEHVLLELLAHADTVVTYCVFIFCNSVHGFAELLAADLYASALGRVLDRVGDNVDEDSHAA